MGSEMCIRDSDFLLLFDRFSILPILKNIAPVDDFEDRCICFMIALETDLGPILVRFWTPQIVPKSVPRGSRKVLEILVDFECFQDPPRINFLANMDPTWLPIRSQVGANLDQNRSENGLGSEVGARADFWSILGRFKIDF